jgi:hypothetical protein
MSTYNGKDNIIAFSAAESPNINSNIPFDLLKTIQLGHNQIDSDWEQGSSKNSFNPNKTEPSMNRRKENIL